MRIRLGYLFVSALFVPLLLVACGDLGLDEERGPLAFIHSVEAGEDEGSYVADIEGDYPDSCSTTGDIEQEVSGKTLVVTVYTEQTEDTECEPVLTAFTDEIVLEVEGLSAGQYTVSVNGTVDTLTLLSDQ